jgi:hypothetical protein
MDDADTDTLMLLTSGLPGGAHNIKDSQRLKFLTNKVD